MAHPRHAVSRMSMIALSVYAGLLYSFLYGPIVMIAFLSFNRSTHHRLSVPGLHLRLVREGVAYAAIPRCAVQQHRRRSRRWLDRDGPGAGADARLPARLSSEISRLQPGPVADRHAGDRRRYRAADVLWLFQCPLLALDDGDGGSCELGAAVRVPDPLSARARLRPVPGRGRHGSRRAPVRSVSLCDHARSSGRR